MIRQRVRDNRKNPAMAVALKNQQEAAKAQQLQNSYNSTEN